MSRVDRKLHRIVAPSLWNNLEIEFHPLCRAEELLDVTTLHSPGKPGKEIGTTGQNKAVVKNIVAWTRHLSFHVRLDLEPTLTSATKFIIEVIGKSKLLSLNMRGSQLDEECWAALDEALNGPMSSCLRMEIAHIRFPSLGAAVCRARILKAIQEEQGDEGDKEAQEDEEEEETERPLINYYQIAPVPASLEFQSKNVGKDRTIYVSVKSFKLVVEEANVSGEKTFYGTDMDTVRRFLLNMGHHRTLDSVSMLYEAEGGYGFSHYKAMIYSLRLRSFGAPLSITKLTIARMSLVGHLWQLDLAMIEIPHLRELHLVECRQFHKLLNRLGRQPGMQLHSFHCINPRRSSEFEDTRCIQSFLERISGLKSLVLLATLPWMLKEDAALSNHMTLEHLELRFEGRNYPSVAISRIHQLCPNLVTFGFQFDMLGKAVKFGFINRELEKELSKYVARLIDFHMLENLALYFAPVKQRSPRSKEFGGNDRFKMVADMVHRLLSEAKITSAVTSPAVVKKITLNMSWPHLAEEEEEKLRERSLPHFALSPLHPFFAEPERLPVCEKVYHYKDEI
jgi:hypothetical protein